MSILILTFPTFAVVFSKAVVYPLCSYLLTQRARQHDRLHAFADARALFQPALERIGDQGLAIMPWVRQNCAIFMAGLELEITRRASAVPLAHQTDPATASGAAASGGAPIAGPVGAEGPPVGDPLLRQGGAKGRHKGGRERALSSAPAAEGDGRKRAREMHCQVCGGAGHNRANKQCRGRQPPAPQAGTSAGAGPAASGPLSLGGVASLGAGADR